MISIKRYSVIKYKKERFYDEVRILVIRIRGAKTKISQYFIAINQLDVVTEPYFIKKSAVRINLKADLFFIFAL